MFNNGKNGINFDRSEGSSALIKIIQFILMEFMRLFKIFLLVRVIQLIEVKRLLESKQITLKMLPSLII